MGGGKKNRTVDGDDSQLARNKDLGKDRGHLNNCSDPCERV